MPDIDPKNIVPAATDLTPDDQVPPMITRSSSEEKDILTPQQSRRKAQNRAAYV
jgi:hypothetical protein